MSSNRITAVYLIETPLDPARAAEVLAGEQSCGTFARVAGETAPLLFTALGNQFWSTSLNEPIAALPLQIYIYASSPYDDQRRMAWAGALVLIALIVSAVSLVRWVTSRGVLKGSS